MNVKELIEAIEELAQKLQDLEKRVAVLEAQDE